MINNAGIYAKLLEQKEIAEVELIPLRQHIRAMAEYFTFWGYHDVANWFWIASSIVKVDYDGIRYDAAFSYCEPAYEYEFEKQKMHSNLINELTVFLYVYSGFEALLSNMALDECPCLKGKINAPKYFLKKEYETVFSLLPKYKNILVTLKDFVKRSSLRDIDVVFGLDNCTGLSGLGIKAVYKLRNKLAHGDYSFPEPLDWSGEIPLEPEIANLSTRVVLMTIQMLFLAQDKGNFKTLQLYESEVITAGDEGEWEIDEFSFLWGIHLDTIDRDKMQLELKF